MKYNKKIPVVLLVVVCAVMLALSVKLNIQSPPKRVKADVEKTFTIPTIDEIIKTSQFDWREYDMVTPVKDQGSTNLCWAYSSIAAAETSILRSGIDSAATAGNLNLNPTAAAYRVQRRTSDPLQNTNGEWNSANYLAATGNPSKIATLFSSWWGPVSGGDATADPFENAKYRLENAFHIPENKEDPVQRIATIKNAVATYGAVTFQYNNANNVYYYNPKNEKGSQSYPHACTIIGWDDDIPAESFSPGGATQNGGWLIKNSYSGLPDGYPYFYISYDNTSSCMYAFSFALKEKYDNNYFYDGLIDDFPLRNDKIAANVYKAKGIDGKTEQLTAVNVGITGNNFTVEAEIFCGLLSPFGQDNAPTAGGKSVTKQTMSFDCGGYVTIPLSNPIKLNEGEWFSVVIRIIEGDAKITLSPKNGKDLSYAGSGSGFSKFGNYVARIKALTSTVNAAGGDGKDEVLDSSVNFVNLVVLAKFNDETEFVNDVYQNCTVKQIIDNTYNKSFYSVSDYFDSISDGKIKMTTLFLLDGGNSLTLSRPRGYYAEKDEFNAYGYSKGGEYLRMAELKEDWSNAVNDVFEKGGKPVDASGKTYDLTELDKNNDGKIDCITVVYKNATQNINVTWGSPLWDYKDNTNLVKTYVNGKELISDKMVQLTFLYESGGESALYKAADELPIVSTGKVCHETLHVFGLKDLYRSDMSSQVYFMSAMGKPISPIVQYVSVKEREALGFLDETQLPALAKDGEYMLNVVAPHAEGIVGYKLDLPSVNKTLYLEYRRFEGEENKYDTKSKTVYSCRFNELIKGQTLKSGLVCYLANSDVRFPSNLGTSGSQWNYAVISNGQYDTKSDSAVGLNETLDITDEISVTVVELSNDKLTFSIKGILTQSQHTHAMKTVNATAPSCTKDGNTDYLICETCGKLFDVDGKTEIQLSDVIIPAAHSLKYAQEVVATCSATGIKAHFVCDICQKYFDTDDKTKEVSYESLETPFDDSNHNLEFIEGVRATCSTNGRKSYYKCKDCQKYFDTDDKTKEVSYESLEIPFDDSNHNLEFVEGVRATCSTHGRKSYYKCKDCQKCFDTDDKTKEVPFDSLVFTLGIVACVIVKRRILS